MKFNCMKFHRAISKQLYRHHVIHEPVSPPWPAGKETRGHAGPGARQEFERWPMHRKITELVTKLVTRKVSCNALQDHYNLVIRAHTLVIGGPITACIFSKVRIIKLRDYVRAIVHMNRVNNRIHMKVIEHTQHYNQLCCMRYGP